MIKVIGWIVFLLLALVVVWSIGKSISFTSLRYPAIPSFSVPQYTTPAVISERTPPTQGAATSSGLAQPEKPQETSLGAQDGQGDISPLHGFVHLIRTGVSAVDPNKEYIEIRVSGDAPTAVPLSGWTLENSSHTRVSIGEGVEVFFPAPTPNISAGIVLKPGMKAVVSTGQSPVGISFRLNSCAGYLDQSRKFTPPLPSNSCPRLTGSLETRTFLDDACLDYIDTVPRCSSPVPPGTLSRECHAYVVSHTTYNSCFSAYRNTPNFSGAEWRIFLQRNQELWKERSEAIILRDHTGRVVDALAY